MIQEWHESVVLCELFENGSIDLINPAGVSLSSELINAGFAVMAVDLSSRSDESSVSDRCDSWEHSLCHNKCSSFV